MGRRNKEQIEQAFKELAEADAAAGIDTPELAGAPAKAVNKDVTKQVADLVAAAEKEMTARVKKDKELRAALEQNQAQIVYWQGRADSLRQLLQDEAT